MIIFSACILISLVLYIYYKVMVVRAKDPLTQEYLNSRSKIFLGSLVTFFGINQYLAYQTRLSLFIGIVFVILGIIQFRYGWKASKHYQREYSKQQSY
ncbi:YtpI family protein [Halobacillus rhizosphaerae]|uniref:YtpI family protein n=1 Tax=Halobacillus rhizosphaerae TaxID=3064889 RepID=UPI00398A9BC6